MEKVVVVVPIYKRYLSPDDHVSIQSFLKHLKGYDFHAVVPEHLYAGFGVGNRPMEGDSGEIDRDGIQGVNRVLHFQSEILSGVEDTCLALSPLARSSQSLQSRCSLASAKVDLATLSRKPRW
jgi:hypothetical protein